MYSDNEFKVVNISEVKNTSTRLKAIDFETDLCRRMENPFKLPKKFKNFNFTRLILIFKQNLYIDKKNVLPDNLLNCLRFIVEQINPIVSMEISHQIECEIIDTDTLISLILNIFAGCLVGEKSLDIELFNLIEDSGTINELYGIDTNINTSYQLFFNYKKMAYFAHEWLKDKKYITSTISPLYSIMPQKRINIKLLLLGKSCCGKSSIIKKYNNPSYDLNSSTLTLGIDIIRKKEIINMLGQNIEVLVEIWDTAGQEKYAPLNNTYLRNVDGVILVYEHSSPKINMLLSNAMINYDFDLKYALQDTLKNMETTFKISKELLEDKTVMYFGNKTDLILKNFIHSYDIDTIIKFIKTNYKYQKNLAEKYTKDSLTQFLSNKNIEFLQDIAISILNSGNFDNYFWGSVLNNLNIYNSMYYIIYNTVLLKLNSNNTNKYNHSDKLIMKENFNKKKSSVECCKIM